MCDGLQAGDEGEGDVGGRQGGGDTKQAGETTRVKLSWEKTKGKWVLRSDAAANLGKRCVNVPSTIAHLRNRSEQSNNLSLLQH